MADDFHAADVWSLLAHWAETTPEAPAFLHGERRDLVRRAARAGAARRPGAGRPRRSVGRSRGAVAAQHPGLSDPLLRLHAAGRHRRRGQHALPRRRGRRHRRPLGRQGAGLRAGLPRHRFPVDPGRDRCRDARSTGGVGLRRRRAATCRPRSSGCAACRSTACCRVRGSAPTTPAPRRPATSSPPRARPARRSSCCTARARSPATPSRWRAASALARPKRCRSRVLPLCGVFGFNQAMSTLGRRQAHGAGRVLRDRGDRAT